MKTRLTFVFVIIFNGISFLLHAQIYFTTRYDFLENVSPSYSHDIIQQGSTYIVFTEIVPDMGYRYFGFLLLDSSGNRTSDDIAYEDSLHGLTTGYSGSFLKTEGGSGFSMVGFKYNYVSGGRWDRGMLWQFDNNLDTLWTRTYSDALPNDTSFLFRNFRELPDKGYIIVGSHGLVDGTAPIRINLHRVDSVGNRIWRKYYGSGNTYYLPFDVSRTSDSGYVIGGGAYPSTGSTSQNDNPILIKTDWLGNQQWLRHLGNDNCREEFAMVDLSCNGKIICGTTFSDSCSGYGDYYDRINFIQINNANTIIWDKKYGFSKHWLWLEKLKVLQNGDIIATGHYDYSDGNTRNEVGWILKTDSAGNEEWYREYLLLNARFSRNSLYNVIPTNDNGFIACGTVWPYPPDTGTQDSWVLKVDSLGCTAPGECWVGQDEIWVKTFTPEKPFIVYPNPATDKLTVEFHINPQGAEFELYDLTGRQVLTDRIAPSRDLIELDIGKLTGGLYILKVIMPGKRPVMEKVVIE